MLAITADGGVIIDVHVQPGGSRDEVVGRHGDALKVKVKVCRGVSGGTGRRKRIRLDGVEPHVASARLDALLG